ncbi:MAG: hypothetical protein WA705_02500 [Candidatus Ozemobacteraceae bacterium]
MSYSNRERDIIRSCVVELLSCMPYYEPDLFSILQLLDRYQEQEQQHRKSGKDDVSTASRGDPQTPDKYSSSA